MTEKKRVDELADRSEAVELTNMCMISDGTKILVEDRRNPAWPGVTFPGGHVEPGESFNHAMIREIREETGLLIRNPRLCGIKQFPRRDGKRYIVLLYRADEYEGRIESSREGRIFWIERSSMGDYTLPENFAEMMQVFENSSLSEIDYHPVTDDYDGEWVTEVF